MRLNTHIIIRILTVILLLTGLSGGGNMAYALSGSGTPSDPYRISSVEDWNSCQAFTNDNYDKYFILTADLTVSQMLSTGAPYFAGVFDGNGHTLTFNMVPTTSSCAPFNHVVKNGTIQNCISSVFCRPGCSLSNCYYTQSFGETIQGESAKKMSDTDLGNAFGHGDGADKNWKLHCDTLYLKPFQRYVDVIGWESGQTPNQPTLTGKRADNNSDTNVTYTYTKFGETDGSPDAPTTKGHYTVKATVPSGTKVENSINNSWPAWESTMNFCVYDAPKPIERNYDPK